MEKSDQIRMDNAQFTSGGVAQSLKWMALRRLPRLASEKLVDASTAKKLRGTP